MWFDEKAINDDIVIFSKVSLVRNLVNYDFSCKLTNYKVEDMVTYILEKIKELAFIKEKRIKFYPLLELNDYEKNAMIERNIISFADKKQITHLLISEDEKINILVNGEEHLKLQTFSMGMEMLQNYQLLDEIENEIAKVLRFAYHKRFGYLTSCPTKTGTGLSLSYMLYLPSLTMAGKIDTLTEEVNKYGAVLKSISVDTAKNTSNIYEIYNQQTLGCCEKDSIKDLNNIVSQITKQERRRKEYILNNHYEQIEDQVYRAYGILKYAKQLNTNDAITLLSEIKYGVDAGMIELGNGINLYRLMLDIQPGTIQANYGKNLSSAKRDKLRAEYLKNILPVLT